LLVSSSITLVWLVFGVTGLLLILVGLWWLVPVLTGLPWRPTSDQRIRAALKMARLQPGEVIYDLGSGDGRVLALAAREYHARAIGVEISPLHCLWSLLYARIQQVADLVTVRQGDFYKTDLMDADVVFAYMTSAQVARLRPLLESQLARGARVVTVSFDMDGWEPQGIDRDQLIFLYEMPPKAGSLETFLANSL
jgi:hypothetical protein